MLGCSLLALSSAANAGDVHWNTVSGLWSNAANWNTASVPTNGDTAFIVFDSAVVTINNTAAVADAVVIGTIINAPTLQIQDAGGAGTLKVNGQFIAAQNGDELATVMVGGSTSKLTVDSALTLGQVGTATMIVSDGADVIANSDNIAADNAGLILGNDPTGNGTLVLHDAGTNLSVTGDAIIGNQGTGELQIDSGADASTSGQLVIGKSGYKDNKVTVKDSGSTLYVSEALIVGDGSVGGNSLALSDGADAFALLGSGTGFIVANAAASVGAVTLFGTGTVLSVAADASIGNRGQGYLSIYADAAVNVTGQLTLGEGAFGLGSIVMYSGSTLAANGGLIVGEAGLADLQIGGIFGAATATANSLSVGNLAGSWGQVGVDSTGSSLTIDDFIDIGKGGTGSLQISNGGVVSNAGGLYSVRIGVSTASEGVVTVSGTGSTLASGSGVVVGLTGTGALTLADGGTVNVPGAFDLAVLAESTGTLNIGAANGQAAVAAGTLLAATVQFGDGTGTINFNHTDADYTFSSNIAGLGTINHLEGLTRLAGNATNFTGSTNVSGGSLFVNGTLGGTVSVTGGTLGGSGTLTGGLAVGSGGTLAPGNSIGTLNVASAAFNTGSTYEVELDDSGFVAGTNNDLLDATGAVTINGGSVQVKPENGTDDGSTYTPGTYTIIKAAGGVSGAFDTLTDDFAFLNFALSYDPNNVYLTSSTVTSFCLSGMSANQCAAGDGVFSVGSGSLYGAVLALSDAEAPAALDLISGEIHASAKTAMIEDSRFLREAALDRIRQAFAETEPDEEGTGLWMHGFGAYGQIDGDGNAAALDRSTGGLFIGADGEVIDNWNVGLLAGYSHSSFSVDDRASSGSADSYHLGAYGGTTWNDLAFRFGGGYSWHDIDVNRSVAFTGFSDSLSSDYWAGTGQLFGELAYGLDAGSARFEPFANLAWVNHSTNDFSEQGGAAALTGAGDVVNATFTTLGVRVSSEFAMGEGTKVHLTGTAGWRHAFGDTPTSKLDFTDGAPFTVAGVPLAENTLVLDAGLDLEITPMATLGFNYSGQIGSGISDHALKANLGVKF